MLLRKYIITYHNDYREGPYLTITDYEENEDGNNFDSMNDFDQMNSEIIEVETEKNIYRVYEITIECEITSRLLRKFNSENEAEDYCKQQFVLLNDSDPFISNGEYSSSYHPKGDRPEVVVAPDAKLELIEPDDGHLHLIIVEEDIVNQHSMNAFSVW